MTDPRRSQAIQAAADALVAKEWTYVSNRDDLIVDAVLAVPPAEPQEGEPRTPLARWRWVCDRIMERKEVIYELTGWSWVGPKAGEPALFEAFDKLAERPVQSSPDSVSEEAREQQVKDLRQIRQALLDGPYLGSVFDALERVEAALGSVREPGPNVTEERKEPGDACRSLAWALYWIGRHGIVPEPSGEWADEWERWAEARSIVKRSGADR